MKLRNILILFWDLTLEYLFKEVVEGKHKKRENKTQEGDVFKYESFIFLWNVINIMFTLSI